MIYADRPRKYSKRGKRWSHLFSPCLKELAAYARTHGLRRRDNSPFPHYDVTEEELALLPGVLIVERREIRDFRPKET